MSRESNLSSVLPDPECPRGLVYEEDGETYAHPADIEQAEREGWHMVVIG